MVRERGVKLWVEGDKLRVRAAEDVLNSELMDAIKQRKPAILALLQPELSAPIVALPAQPDYELSAAQRRLWVLAQLPNGSAAYNIPLHQLLRRAARLRRPGGSLSPASPTPSVSSHHVRFHARRTPAGGEFAVSRLDRVPRSFGRCGRRNGGASSLAGRRPSRPFDIEVGPLWRVALLKLAEQKHVLIFTIHHLIADGVSVSVLARDLSRFYRAARDGRPDDLPALAFGYPDFAAWHNRLLSREQMATHRKYWHDTLSGDLPVLNLPTDYPRPPEQRYRGRELSFTLGAGQLDQLEAFARQRKATLFMALHSILKVLLFAYTGQEDAIVGCAIAGREHPDLENQVGLYVNTLALRSRLRSDTSFEEFFGEVAQLTKAAFDHQTYQFDQLVSELNVARDLSRFPLFDVMLIEQNQDDPGLDLEGLRARAFFEHPGTSKFDLTFCFKAMPGKGLMLGIEFNTDLFCEDRIRRMGGHVVELIDSILTDPSQSVGRLNVLPASERRELIDGFNRTASPYPKDSNIVELLEAAAGALPDAVAVVCGARELSYRELHARANQLAWHLQGLGIEPGATVGIWLDRSPELVIALLGVLKAGAAYVPLDPRHPPDRVARIVDDARLSVLINRGGAQDILLHRNIASVDLDAERGRIAQQSNQPPPREIQPGHLAYVIYTSGTTGSPKGVEIPHRAMLNFLLAMADRPGLTQGDVLLAVTTISFDIAALEIYLPLIPERSFGSGRRRRRRRCRAIDVADAKVGHHGHAGDAVDLADAVDAQAGRGAADSRRSAAARHCRGELGEQLLAEAESVWNMYGPTETTIWSTVRKLERSDGPRDAVESIGRPIANTTVYILDRQLRPVPIGVAGDLYIGGDGLALGYRNLPELTAERFLRHPFEDDGKRRLYATGDVARYRQNGDIEYLGRTDQQVKLRGYPHRAGRDRGRPGHASGNPAGRRRCQS